MNLEKYNETMEYLHKNKINIDILCLINNCFYDFDSRNVDYDPERVIEVISSEEIIMDSSMLIFQSLEDVFDEIEDRL